jgi:hypothetical protein
MTGSCSQGGEIKSRRCIQTGGSRLEGDGSLVSRSQRPSTPKESSMTAAELAFVHALDLDIQRRRPRRQPRNEQEFVIWCFADRAANEHHGDCGRGAVAARQSATEVAAD